MSLRCCHSLSLYLGKQPSFCPSLTTSSVSDWSYDLAGLETGSLQGNVTVWTMPSSRKDDLYRQFLLGKL